MRLQIHSDLHVEFLADWDDYSLASVGADVLVLAGDIANGGDGVRWAGQQATHLGIPAVYVPGNHEYYHHDMIVSAKLMQRAASWEGVYLLDNSACVIGGVRFLGSTLWTDYCAAGDPDRAKEAAARDLNDHRLIQRTGRVFAPKDAAALHAESVAWLSEQLNTPFSGKTVVVTHHGPTPAAQNPDIAVDELSGAFWSDLEHLVALADLWVYGHTHTCLDQLVAGTRVVSNQAGYRRSSTSPPEDSRYDPYFVVDL